jgi:hypothetical protein
MTTDTDQDGRYAAAETFLDWMHARVIADGRGDELDELGTAPRSRFWLGRLAPEALVMSSPLGRRAEKMDPCAIGLRLRPVGAGPWRVELAATFSCWTSAADGTFTKTDAVSASVDAVVSEDGTLSDDGSAAFDFQFEARGLTGRHAQFRVDVESWRERTELVLSLVNTGDEPDKTNPDTHLYEAAFEVHGLATEPFLLEALPDSFRYDRRVPAIGINCGVRLLDDGFATSDTVEVVKDRPSFWNSPDPEPAFDFVTMSTNPLPSVRGLIDAATRWGATHWSQEALLARADHWSAEMLDEARIARDAYASEIDRLERGYKALTEDPDLLRAFRIASTALLHSSAKRYDSWRPFQLGFLVSAMTGITDPDDAQYVDTVWFATGGGKTETYLGLLVTAIIYDRLTGKSDGITAWTRFPLRSLSLQQTQRFADALAGAELERRAQGIGGRPISLGFFVGAGSTPNKIGEEDEVTHNRDLPRRYQVLLRCPFCRSEDLSMRFDRTRWTLDHVCTDTACPWGGDALPFHIVDQEIYRFLPTVIVGTLDKAALVAMQGAMRGFFAAPAASCSDPRHGYCYSPRSTSPSGCLVPGCNRDNADLPMPAERYAPRLRLQDELHLLRDSLGAVDSHYESLLDHLQAELTGTKAKIIASSATLSGFRRQIDVLYRRDARVFPQPGPTTDESFWSQPSDTRARTYVAVAPRGVTAEYVSDRILGTLQQCVRDLVDDPDGVSSRLGIPRRHVGFLVSVYGVDLVYGNTVRDVEASRRAAETEFPFPVNVEALTGGTQFDQVRDILERLDRPEDRFGDRIHIVAASSMISHGVDIDRLNLMVMKGLPLTTAEFIQTSARVGRRWPGMVYVLHRITREREVSTYAQFERFITQGDRFVEPIPITRSSRRVLELTTAGAEEARRLAIHDYRSPRALTTVRSLREYYRSAGIDADSETAGLIDALGMTGPLEELQRADIAAWAEEYFDALDDPATRVRWPQDLSPTGTPMRSLRDVDAGVPVVGEDR